jgi:hypothetical protein
MLKELRKKAKTGNVTALAALRRHVRRLSVPAPPETIELGNQDKETQSLKLLRHENDRLGFVEKMINPNPGLKIVESDLSPVEPRVSNHALEDLICASGVMNFDPNTVESISIMVSYNKKAYKTLETYTVEDLRKSFVEFLDYKEQIEDKDKIKLVALVAGKQVTLAK